MEQLFVIALVLLAAGVKWMMKSDSTDEGESTDSDPIKSAREEERMRKFMDALGVPEVPTVQTRRVPRPRVRIRTEPKTSVPAPRKFVAPVPQHPWVETGFPPILEAPLSPPLTAEAVESEPVLKPEILPEPIPAEPASPVFSPSVQVATPSVRRTQSELVATLRNPDNLRMAILAREILGPPRGLQPLFDTPFAARR